MLRVKNQASAVLLILVAAACDTDRGTPMNDITGPASARTQQQVEFPAPSGLVTLSQGGTDAEVWPYTSTGFSTTPQDPVNLVFFGARDPRQIRSTLMSLSGSGRPGPLAGFTCTWSDAVGDPQTGYSSSEGWVPSAIQLQCGNFFGPRFHLRIFRQGNVTLANAHYEILIPGTNMHEVLSWELAEALVAADIARSGHLGAAPAPSSVITGAPYYRAVQAAVASLLPPAQIAALGLRVNGDGTASIPNDGRATMLLLASAAPVTEGMVDSDFVIPFNQLIPKPFCTAGTTGYLFASGPVTIHMRSGIIDGNFESTTSASGTLDLVEFNPITRQHASAPYQGSVGEKTSAKLTNGAAWVEFFSTREETPDNGTNRGIRVESLRARERGLDFYKLDISC